MITVSAVDRLVVQDDTALARVWSQLGERLRAAYAADRDGWVVLRRQATDGRAIDQPTLTAQHNVFSGWARALRLAGQRRPSTTAKIAPARTATAPAAAAVPAPSPAARPGMGGAAVAGVLVIASVVAVAAARRRA